MSVFLVVSYMDVDLHIVSVLSKILLCCSYGVKGELFITVRLLDSTS